MTKVFVLIVTTFTVLYAGSEEKGLLAAAAHLYKDHYNFYYTNPNGIKEDITPRLFNILTKETRCTEKEQGICAIDADPWIEAQDGEIRNPNYSITAIRNGTGKVKFSYTFYLSETQQYSKNITLVFKFDKTNSNWKFDDIVYADDSSLVGFMETWHAKYNGK